jgi:shikimate dehydrogenase
MVYKLGLTGFPLGHSLSPILHSAALNAAGLEGDYCLFPISPDNPQALAELIGRLRAGELNGLNITIPHKQTIISLLDQLTPSAQAIGAVNTIYIENGILIGHNTDAPGFLADLAKFLAINVPDPQNADTGKKVVVLGVGGAARAVVHALLSDGWNVTLAVRRADVKQAGLLIESFKQQAGDGSMHCVLLEADDLSRLGSGMWLIVNATPLGMFPETEISPWPIGAPFPLRAMVYDVIYNPRQTRLVQDAQAAGLRATTGLGMLVEQAALSFACWTGQDVPRNVMFAAVEA